MNWQPDVARDFSDYLRDESRRLGQAEFITFPASTEELAAALRDAHARHLAVTLQGARTGIAAGAVPDGGSILNLSRMTRVLGLRQRHGLFYALVQPGVLLSAFRTALAKREFDTAGWDADSRAALAALRAAPRQMLTADPTETSASLGGMTACNASGARSFKYGAVRHYVEALHVVLADGATVELRRGAQQARGRAFTLALPDGRSLASPLPAYTMPAVKNAAGYYAADHMDLVDLFIGSEGTLGAIAAIELRLTPEPALEWGMTAFLPSTAAVCQFVRRARGEYAAGSGPLAAIEYFSGSALALLRHQKATNPAFAIIPDIPEGFAGAVYVEIHAETEAAAQTTLEKLVEFLNACGGNEDTAWLATTPQELERLHRFRHAVPEAVNLLIGERKKTEPGLTKLGTDMAVPDGALETVMALYETDLARLGLESVVFGHIGNNHVHVNILPRTLADYETGKKLYQHWAERVCGLGGTISAEHGVGKLKTALLAVMYGETGIAQMRAVKQVFDPDRTLGRGNLFS